MRENELADEKAQQQAAGTNSGEENEAEETASHENVLKLARKTPNTLPQGTPQYWKAVANQTVRMYRTRVTEGATAASVMSSVEKLNLPTGEVGKSVALVHLDTS